MTKGELAQLIIVIYASERRADAPSKAVVEAWHPQLERFGFEDALKVVSEHYAGNERPITLAQLCDGLRKRQPRPTTDQVRERLLVPDADPDNPLAYLEALKQRKFQAERNPEDFAPQALELPKMVRVAGVEVPIEEKPRPRRWWLPRGKGPGADPA